MDHRYKTTLTASAWSRVDYYYRDMDMSYREIADLCGLSHTTIWRLHAGEDPKVNVSADAMLKIIDALPYQTRLPGFSGVWSDFPPI